MGEKRIIRVIPATSTERVGLSQHNIKKKKVAAYCRVSTDSEEQASSYEAQVDYYTRYIQKQSNWEFAGVFADDGISGTNTKKRTAFNTMIQACMDGDIDMIITKSISRFARNTLDCLRYIRQLKEYNVPVYFEKENINTMDSKGEVLLTIMASLAQQESESISKNVKMGIQYRYQKGEIRINHNRFLGYTKDDNKNLVIDPSEAKIVRRIFKEYLEGSSLNKIAKGLMADDILTAANKPLWRGEAIRKILSNEKYMGDALLQKTYTIDVLNKKRVVNNGIVPQYYVENSHEGIISREMFQKVQVELKRRSELNTRKSNGSSAYSSKYLLSSLVYCKKCGAFFRRIAHTTNSKSYVNWRCKTRVTKGVCHCDSNSISEKELHNFIVRAINKFIDQRGSVLPNLIQNVESVLMQSYEVDEQITKLQLELEECIHQNKDYNYITKKLDKLRLMKENLKGEDSKEDEIQNRLIDIKQFIEKQSTLLQAYDEDIVRRLISKVIVSDNAIEIIFKTEQLLKLRRYQK